MSSRYVLEAPIEIEALEIKGGNFEEIEEFGGDTFLILTNFGVIDRLLFKNPMGDQTAYKGDILLKGPDGQFYMTKKHIFEQFYKKVDTPVEV